MSPRGWTFAVVVLLAAVLVTTPVAADAGGVILDYLQQTLKPAVDSIQSGVSALQAAVTTLQSSVNTVQAGVSSLQTTISALQTSSSQTSTNLTAMSNTVAAQPVLHIVKTTITTLPHQSTGYDIDFKAIPLASYNKLKKYTITMLIRDSFGGAPSGMDTIYVFDTVVDKNGTSLPITIAQFDPANGQKSLVLPTFAGSNATITVSRGDDGLGAIDVTLDAYIESEP